MFGGKHQWKQVLPIPWNYLDGGVQNCHFYTNKCSLFPGKGCDIFSAAQCNTVFVRLDSQTIPNRAARHCFLGAPSRGSQSERSISLTSQSECSVSWSSQSERSVLRSGQSGHNICYRMASHIAVSSTRAKTACHGTLLLVLQTSQSWDHHFTNQPIRVQHFTNQPIRSRHLFTCKCVNTKVYTESLLNWRRVLVRIYTLCKCEF